MAVEWMCSNKQAHCLFKTLFNIFAANVIIQHEMSEYLDIKDHFLVVQGFFKFERDEGSKVIAFKLKDDISFSGQKQFVDAT